MPLVSMDAHLTTAQQRVATVINRGSDLILRRASARDAGGRITTESDTTVKTFPVRFTPFDRAISSKVSWSDEVDVIFTIEFKNRNWKKIRAKYGIVEHDGVEYDVKHVEPFGAFADTFLYIRIGGVKKK